MTMQYDIVHDMKVEKGRPVLRLRRVETRRFLTHDEAISLTELPEIFYPVSASGSAVAVFQAAVTPMMALGAISDAGFFAFEDIDRLDALRAEAEKDKKSVAFQKLMQGFLLRAMEIAAQKGSFRLPSPPVAVLAYRNTQEVKRRRALAIEKLKAEAGES